MIYLVLPAYNEERDLGALLERVAAARDLTVEFFEEELDVRHVRAPAIR